MLLRAARFALLLLATQLIIFAPSATGSQSGGHTSNWAVIVSTSRYWQNYRHSANALSFYHLCREKGIDDDHILLLLADSVACDPRNYLPGTIFSDSVGGFNLQGCSVRADIVGYDVDIATTLKLMMGRPGPNSARSAQLRSDAESNVLFYLTGHGGEEFIKFQDVEYLGAADIAAMIDQMHQFKRFKNLLMIAETCHAQSLCLGITTPGVVCVSSAKVNEDSYSHHSDINLGVAVIDRFTFESLQFLTARNMNKTLAQWVNHFTFQNTKSTVTATGGHLLHKLRVRDFFTSASSSRGGVKMIDIKEDIFG